MQRVSLSSPLGHLRRVTRTMTPAKCVMAHDLNVIQNMLKKQPSAHFVNGLNVADDVVNSKVVYVFKDPIKDDDTLVHIKQGALAATSSYTMDTLKKHLDLDFDVFAITQKDFKLYLNDTNVNGIVIYNAYSDMRFKATYFLYFDVSCLHDLCRL